MKQIMIDHIMKSLTNNYEYNKDFWMRNKVNLTPLRPPKSFMEEFNKYPTEVDKRNAKPRKETFFTFDVETKDGLLGKEIFCWSLAYPKDGKMEVLQGHEDLTPLMEFIGRWKDKSHFRVIYVHNLGFDIRFIANWCAHNNITGKPLITGSNVICYTIDEMKVKFVDSYQFLLESQESAEIRYGVDEELRKINCDKIFNKPYSEWNRFDKRKVLAHNRNDVLALHQIMTKYRLEMFNICGVDVLSKISLASIALKAFRITLNVIFDEEGVPFMRYDKEKRGSIQNPFLFTVYKMDENGKSRVSYQIDRKRESFVRESYFGGRTEVFRTDLLENGLYVDRVSMYPSEMKEKYYPVGIPYWVNDRDKLMKIIDGTIDKLGFIRARVYHTDKVKTNYPVLPSKIDNKVMFLNADMRGTYTVPELQYAYQIGYEIEPITGLIFEEKRKIFTEFVDTFYPIKQHSKGGKRQVAKILLNSCYGKFGQRFTMKSPTFHYFMKEEDMFDYIQDKDENVHVAKDKDNPLWITTELMETTITHPYQNVAIASYVTAYGRLSLTKKLHELEKEGINVWYCDTDSVVIPRYITRDGKTIDLKPKYTSEKHELGDWDIEKEFDKVKFLAPKAYISVEESKLKLKLKGVEKRKIKEICETSESLTEVEEKIRAPIELAERYMTFAQAHRNGCIIGTRKLVKHYSYDNQKRFILSDGSTRAWDNTTICFSNHAEKWMEWLDIQEQIEKMMVKEWKNPDSDYCRYLGLLKKIYLI